MNCYATVDQLKSRLGISVSDYDALILELLEESSRDVDDFCRRRFWTSAESRDYSTGDSSSELLIDDCLAITTLTTDSESDGTFDGETWSAAAGDFYLGPVNDWPKTRVHVGPSGNYAFPIYAMRYVRIAGTFGFGNGQSADPWEATSINATVATAAGVTLTLSAAGMKAGQTIKVGTEQLFVSAVASNGLSATVERGVNGTTAAIHNAAAVSVALYPALVTRGVLALCVAAWNQRRLHGLEMLREGNNSWAAVKHSSYTFDRALLQMVGSLRRLTA